MNLKEELIKELLPFAGPSYELKRVLVEIITEVLIKHEA